MRQVRHGVFETNSSSTHSLTVCTQDEFDRWERGELLFDRWGDEFVEASTVKTGSDMDKIKAKYEDVRGKLWKNFEDLTKEEVDEFCEEYCDEEYDDEYDDDQYVTFDWSFDHYNEWFDTYVSDYTSEHGDKIIMFGYYGHD